MTFPGQNKFKNGFIKDDANADLKLLNHPDLYVHLQEVGLEFIEIAIGVYEARTHHDPEDPAPEYATSFTLNDIYMGLIHAIEVRNTDQRAEWVEFGAHAGGKTLVLRYKPMTTAADILESRFL